jgi:hypothetical protein
MFDLSMSQAPALSARTGVFYVSIVFLRLRHIGPTLYFLPAFISGTVFAPFLDSFMLKRCEGIKYRGSNDQGRASATIYPQGAGWKAV